MQATGSCKTCPLPQRFDLSLNLYITWEISSENKPIVTMSCFQQEGIGIENASLVSTPSHHLALGHHQVAQIESIQRYHKIIAVALALPLQSGDPLL